MPTYEYKCDSCGHGFERFQRMTDKPLKKCPECSSPVKRVIGPGAGIIFKGKGFYQTDYKAAPAEKCDKVKNGKAPMPCCKPDTCSSCE